MTTTKKINYLISPFDGVFFRDGRPFKKGEETWGRAVFPPSPSTIYGALRAFFFSHSIEELKLANTEDDPTKSLQIKALHLVKEDSQKDRRSLFPVAMDLVAEKDSKDNKVYPLHLKELEGTSSYQLSHYLTSPENLTAPQNKEGFIELEHFLNYLEGSPKLEFTPKSDLILEEPKVGIGLSKPTRTSKEGHLYRISLTRPARGVKFGIEIEGLNLPPEGLVRLGGEGKGASLKSNTPCKIPFPSNFDQNSTYFKVYLSTPAIFEGGWLPSWIDKDSKIGKIGNLKLKLIAAAVGKPDFIGGFDIKKRIPKAMYRAVRAGSVYYFELLEGNWKEVKSQFHGQAISDQRPKEGFGISYVGSVK